MFLFLCNVRLPLLVLHDCVVSVVALLEIGMDVRGSRSQGEGTGAQGFRAAATADAGYWFALLSKMLCFFFSILFLSAPTTTTTSAAGPLLWRFPRSIPSPIGAASTGAKRRGQPEIGIALAASTAP